MRCSVLLDTEGLSGAASANANDGAGDAQRGAFDATLDAGLRDASVPLDATLEAALDASTDARVLPDGAVVWPVNGHAYLAVAEVNISWSLAKERAEAMGGHLATMESLAENQYGFDVTLLTPGVWNGEQGPWLGGYQVAGSVEPGGGWTWLGGAPIVSYAWKAGEPSNSADGEDHLSFGAPSMTPASTWNDTRDMGSIKDVNAYLVEFE